jgi:glycerophosphoryl diester phosphodiesterase
MRLKPWLHRAAAWALLAGLLLGNAAPSYADSPRPVVVSPFLLTPAVDPALRLPSYFDCLREKGVTLVSAHRMGPAKGFPENSVETMAYTAARAPVAVEMDVRRTKDGALVLLHDESLERTTTGKGALLEKSFAELKDVALTDPSGQKTPFTLPSLALALERVKELDIIAQLDIKRDVSFAQVAQAVARATAYNNVIIIVYTLEDAILVHQLDPNLMISVSVNQPSDLDRLRQANVNLKHILGFTGTRGINEALYQALAQAGVETILGTLGKPGERLDDRYLADGDASEYALLASQGVQVIATDRPIEAYAALKAAGKSAELCTR